MGRSIRKKLGGIHVVKEITAKELANRILSQKETFILDIRNAEEFNNWKIEGKRVAVLNKPYFNLLDGVRSLEGKMDKNQEIIVVCAKGGTSEMISNMLADAGYTKVYNLHGGMAAWSEHLEPIKIGELKDGGTLYQFIRLGKGCLSYFIQSNGEAAVIDSSRNIEVYETFAKNNNLNITHVLDTHLHADHISGGRHLAERVGGSYHLPPKDATEVVYNYEPLIEGEDISVGKTSIKVQPIYSPGHTIGSTSFIVDDQYLLTGDILFVESIGRPDLAGKAEDWVSDLRETLYTRYKELSEDLIVLPAHFSFINELNEKGSVSARLGDLYKENLGLQVKDEEDFKKMVTEDLPPQPNAHLMIRETNMGKHTPSVPKQQEMEMGPNRCAVHK